MSATTAQRANCTKTKSNSGIDLKLCANCHITHYCSRECQKANWKVHKRVCRSNAASAIPHSPRINPTPSVPAAAGDPPKGLAIVIDKPFHRLDARIWLHGRPEQDVFNLLIDTYRLRMEDNYKIEGDADDDSIHGGAQDGRHGFRRFLRLAEKRGGLLPSWWSQEKAVECVNGGWSSLADAVEKSDIIDHYGSPNMPRQLRMFGEQVYGRGPGGQSGAGMRQIQMMAEKGEIHTDQIDMAPMFHHI